jgi:hypothetical protein
MDAVQEQGLGTSHLLGISVRVHHAAPGGVPEPLLGPAQLAYLVSLNVNSCICSWSDRLSPLNTSAIGAEAKHGWKILP